MPFTLIKGTLNPTLGHPDGDSLRFVPDDPGPIFRLQRRRFSPKINQNNGSIQLRFEGIDTMESAADGEFSQPATNSNLELANPDNPGQPSRGYIYSNQIGPNGRPIAFVFSGDIAAADGSDAFLSADDIMQSINVQQLQRGHAYPLFYDTLFDDLRHRMREVSQAAKRDGRGLWPSDKTNDATAWPGSLEELPPIFPKLWRRIQGFRRDETLFDPDKPFANFKEWIEIEKDERVAIPSQDTFTGFDDLLETTDDTVRMTIDPHDMVIVSV